MRHSIRQQVLVPIIAIQTIAIAAITIASVALAARRTRAADRRPARRRRRRAGRVELPPHRRRSWPGCTGSPGPSSSPMTPRAADRRERSRLARRRHRRWSPSAASKQDRPRLAERCAEPVDRRPGPFRGPDRLAIRPPGSLGLAGPLSRGELARGPVGVGPGAADPRGRGPGADGRRRRAGSPTGSAGGSAGSSTRWPGSPRATSASSSSGRTATRSTTWPGRSTACAPSSRDEADDPPGGAAPTCWPSSPPGWPTSCGTR